MLINRFLRFIYNDVAIRRGASSYGNVKRIVVKYHIVFVRNWAATEWNSSLLRRKQFEFQTDIVWFTLRICCFDTDKQHY